MLCFVCDNRHKEAEQKLTRMEALSDGEQDVYDNIDPDVVNEKTVWLTSLVSCCCTLHHNAALLYTPVLRNMVFGAKHGLFRRQAKQKLPYAHKKRKKQNKKKKHGHGCLQERKRGNTLAGHFFFVRVLCV